MLKIVVDPGVLISARLSGRGAPAELIRSWLDGQIELIVSPYLLGELSEVLRRPKFRKWLTLKEVEDYVSFLENHALMRPDPPLEHGLTPDPDDDYLVVLARSAHANLLVSGDSDLIDLVDPTPPVLTPRRLITLLDELDRP
ncbi:MAG: putative toxin-antitoxin system toxin component, PIN family [Microthrixaceae bacterium]|nr:putative toxin-antitoxin system toxin component, PIN family [Microthrixaceae bacterium]